MAVILMVNEGIPVPGVFFSIQEFTLDFVPFFI